MVNIPAMYGDLGGMVVMALCYPHSHYIWGLPILVGGFNPSEKYESQLGWLETQYMGK